jgi:hypothetical protein
MSMLWMISCAAVDSSNHCSLAEPEHRDHVSMEARQASKILACVYKEAQGKGTCADDSRAVVMRDVDAC